MIHRFGLLKCHLCPTQKKIILVWIQMKCFAVGKSMHPGMSAPPSDVKLALQRTSSTLLQQIEAGHSHGKDSVSTHTFHTKCANDFQQHQFE